MVHRDKDPTLSVTGNIGKFTGLLEDTLQIGQAKQLLDTPFLCLLSKSWMLLDVAG